MDSLTPKNHHLQSLSRNTSFVGKNTLLEKSLKLIAFGKLSCNADSPGNHR